LLGLMSDAESLLRLGLGFVEASEARERGDQPEAEEHGRGPGQAEAPQLEAVPQDLHALAEQIDGAAVGAACETYPAEIAVDQHLELEVSHLGDEGQRPLPLLDGLIGHPENGEVSDHVRQDPPEPATIAETEGERFGLLEIVEVAADLSEGEKRAPER